MTFSIQNMASQAKEAANVVATLTTETKNRVLMTISANLQAHTAKILAANKLDMDAAKKNEMFCFLSDSFSRFFTT